MTETPALTRALVDHVTTTGRLDLSTWCNFKREHRVEPHQIEPVLVEVIAHVLVLAGELQKEMDRLSHALARRG